MNVWIDELVKERTAELELTIKGLEQDKAKLAQAVIKNAQAGRGLQYKIDGLSRAFNALLEPPSIQALTVEQVIKEICGD